MRSWPPPNAVSVDVGDAYHKMASVGYQYGPVFRGLKSAWHRGDVMFAEVVLPETARLDTERFGLHPALLDAALHATLSTAAVSADGEGSIYLPYAWEGVSLSATRPTALRVRIETRGPCRFALDLADSAGQPVARVDSLLIRALPAGLLEASRGVTESDTQQVAPVVALRTSPTGETDPPRTASERAVAQLMEQVLGITNVGRGDEFFALGGDSIAALQIAARAREADLPLTPQMLFEHPTVEHLAAALDAPSSEATGRHDDHTDGAIEGVRHQPMSVSGLSPEQLAALEASWPDLT
jgi:acyl transferase domain-containing protein